MPQNSETGATGAAPRRAKQEEVVPPPDAGARPSAESVYHPAAVVRHLARELREPLSAIDSIACYLDIVLPRADTKGRRQLAKLRQEVRQINWILSDAVHFLRAAPLRLEALDLSEVLSRALSEWRAPDGPSVALDLQRRLPLVNLDLEQVQHMLRNLVAFFGRFSSSERPISVRVYTFENTVKLEVKAETPQCSPADVQPLFDPFESNLPGGAGLGLASVRRIAEAHGARVDAATDPPGTLALTITFPPAATGDHSISKDT